MSGKIGRLCLLVLLSPVCLVGCQSSTLSPYINEDVLEIYSTTFSSLNPTQPGLGRDPYQAEGELEHAMTYALLASSEARRYQLTGHAEALDNAVEAAKWLLENSIQNNVSETGWGLPFAWDAFADGSLNSKNTIYTITTSLGILSLLDVYDAISTSSVEQALKPDLIAVAAAAADTFSDGKFDDLGAEIVFWYSNRPQDSYHVFNVTAMMLGAFQRLSRYVDEPRRSRYQMTADRAAAYVLARFKRDDLERIYWSYSGDVAYGQNSSNDAVHEAYVFYGLLTYKHFGGTLADAINLNDFYAALTRFIDEDGIREWAKGEGADNRHARLWGAGYLLFISSVLEQALNTAPKLSSLYYCELINAYYSPSTQRWRYRANTEDFTVYPRHTSHLLLGLVEAAGQPVSCNANPAAVFKATTVFPF